MLFVSKKGIVFGLVQNRFKSFRGMTNMIKHAISSVTPQYPLVIVFPEAVFGERTITRRETKDWIINQVKPVLKARGNAFVFLSVFEHTSRDSLSNTGYLINPSGEWKAYAKAEMPLLDSRMNKRLSNPRNAIDRWERRKRKMEKKGARLKQKYSKKAKQQAFPFPNTTIKTANGQEVAVELRVCADILSLGKEKSNDVLVVPAQGLGTENLGKVESNIIQNTLRSAMKRNGFAIINDTRSNKSHFAHLISKKGLRRQITVQKANGTRVTHKKPRQVQRRI